MASATVKDNEIDGSNRTTANLCYASDEGISGQWSPFNQNGEKVYSKEFLLAFRKHPKSNNKPKNLPAELMANEKKKSIKNSYERFSQLFPNFKDDSFKVEARQPLQSELSTVPKTISSNIDMRPVLNISSAVGNDSAENKNVLPVKSVNSKKISKSKVVPAALTLHELHATAIQLKKKANFKSGVDADTKDTFNLACAMVEQHVPFNKDNFEYPKNNKLNNTPVSEIENDNSELSCKGNTKNNQKRDDFLDLKGIDDLYRPYNPGNLKTTPKQAITTPNNNLKVQQTIPQQPSTNMTPQRAPPHNFHPPVSQTPVTNHRQGQALFQMQSAQFNSIPLQPALHYGNTIQYFNRGPPTLLNYAAPGYQMIPNQTNTYQYPQHGVAVYNPGLHIGSQPKSNIRTDSNISAETSIKVPRQLTNILEGYLNNQYSVQDVQQKIKAFTLPSAHPQLIIDGCINVLEKSKKARLQTGFLFAQLIKLDSLTVEDYCVGLEVVLKKSEEVAIDIPGVWDYVAELVFPVLCEGATVTNNLHRLFNSLIRKTHAAKLLARLFKLMLKGNEENCSLSLADYTTIAVASNVLKTQPPNMSALGEQISDQLQTRLNSILEEYLNDRYSVEECLQHIKTSFPPVNIPELVSLGSIIVLKRSKMSRLRTGFLFAQLIKGNILSIPNYCACLEIVIEKADELAIDFPKVWDHVAELISPVLCENAVTLRSLQKSFELLISNNHASELLHCLFNLIIQEKGLTFLQSIWNSSSLTFADYMAESEVESFLKENNFEFLLRTGDSSLLDQNSEQDHLIYDEVYDHLFFNEVHDKLLGFFKSDTPSDEIINWITENVGERVKENHFTRTLATACFENSIVNLKLNANNLQRKCKLLYRFVDKRLAYELEVLYALQAFIEKLEHPPELMLAVCDQLYKKNVLPHRSFMAWKACTDPSEQKGKDAALKQLTSFFSALKESEEDSTSTSTD